MKGHLEKIMELTLSKDQSEKDLAQEMIRTLVRETRPVPNSTLEKNKRYRVYSIVEHLENPKKLMVHTEVWSGTMAENLVTINGRDCVIIFLEML
jgi:hypothetical protein